MALKVRITDSELGVWPVEDSSVPPSRFRDGDEVISLTAEVYDDATPETVVTGPITRTYHRDMPEAQGLRAIAEDLRNISEAESTVGSVSVGTVVDLA